MGMTVPDLPGGAATLLSHCKQFSGATRYTFHYRLAATLRFLLENQPFSTIWTPYLAFLVCGCVRQITEGGMGNAAKMSKNAKKRSHDGPRPARWRHITAGPLKTIFWSHAVRFSLPFSGHVALSPSKTRIFCHSGTYYQY